MKSKESHSIDLENGLPPQKRLKSYFDDQVESPFYSKFPASIRDRSLDEYKLWKISLLKDLDFLISDFHRLGYLNSDTLDIFAMKLERFINLKFPFSLEEKATMLNKLMLFVEQADKVDFRNQCTIFFSMSSLIKHKENLDLIVPWRPFAKILEDVYFSKYRRVVYTPKSHSQSITSLIKKIRRYFPSGTIQELLETYRPLFCLHDHLLFKAQGFVCLFLPTNHRESFWLPEIVNIWKWIGLYPSWDSQFFLLLSNTAEMCIGQIDWNPYLDFIFQKIIVAFGLPIGNSAQLYDEFPMEECNVFVSFDFSKDLVSQHAATFIIWTFGSKNFQSFSYLKRLIKSIESFSHPSNEGEWSEQLAGFLLELTTQFAKRCQLEFNQREKPVTDIPLCSVKKVVREEYMLSEDFQKEFVELLYPILLKAMYSKSHHMQACANHSLKQLCYIKPDIVFPPLLNQCFHALQTLTEVHQTVAALEVLSLVAFPLVRENLFPSGEEYLLDLLSLTLPGIDNNDYKKTWSTLKFITAFLVCVPLFTEENGISPQTISFFEEWCFKLLDRIFSLLQNEGLPIFSNNNTSDDYSSSIFRGFCNLFFQQLSPGLYEKCLKKVFQFVSTEFLVNAKENIGNLCEAVAFANQKVALQYFVPLCHDRLVDKKTGKLQQVTDNEKMWYVYILARVIKRAGSELIPYQSQICKVVELLIDTDEKKITESLSKLVQNYLYSLTSYYTKEVRSQNPTIWAKLSTEEHWKYWGKFPLFKDLEVTWHIPSRQEIIHAVVFVNQYLVYICNILQDYIVKVKNDEQTTLSRNHIFSLFSLLESFVRYVPNFIPEMKEGIQPEISLFPEMEVCGGKIDYIPEANEPELLISLERITDLCCEAATVLFTKQRDVSLLIPVIIDCFPPLVCIRFGELKNSFTSRKSAHNLVKIQNFMVFHRDQAKYPRYLSLARVSLELAYRGIIYTETIPFTSYHERVLETLLTISLSSYQKLRKKVHTYVMGIFYRYSPILMKRHIPKLIDIISDRTSTDDEVLGALSLLTKTQCVDDITHNWELLSRLVISLSKSQHIEKETTQTTLGEVFDIYFNSLYQIKINNQVDEQIYRNLILELVQIAQDGSIHWKFQTMISSFLLLLIRADGILFPMEGICYLFSQLASDIPRVRLISSEAANLILAQFRPVQPKKTVHLNEKNIVGKWNTFPIPTNEQEFQQCSFFEKNYFGWYELPSSIEVYDYSKPYNGPTPEIEQLREGLKAAFRKIMSPEWLERFFRYNTDRDGDPFSETMTQLYKGLFQIFGMEFYDIARPHIQRISKEAGSGKADESGHIAAISEFVSGFIRGMKNWSFELQQKCQLELISFWDEILDKCSQGTITEWTDGFEFAFSDKDPRRNRIIIEYFFNKFKQNLGSTSSNIQSRYVQFLYSVVGEISWRDTDLMQRVLKELSSFQCHPYQQVRENISLMMALIMKTIWVPRRNEFGRPAIRLPTTHLDPLLQDHMTVSDGDETEFYFPYIHEFIISYLSLMEEDINSGKLKLFSLIPSSSDELSQKEEQRRLLKNFADTIFAFISGLYSTCAPHSMEKYTIDFIRVCTILQDQSDESMHSDANDVLLTIADFPFSPLDAKDIVSYIIKQFNTFTNWRVRKSLLNFLNIFIFRNQFSLEQDKESLFSLMLQGLKDQQVEVRQAASTTLAGYLKISDDSIVKHLAQECVKLAKDPSDNRQKRRKRRGSIPTVTPQIKRQEDIISRHAGVLGLRAVIAAYPHEIPDFLPPILVLLAKYSHDRVQQIRESVRLTFSDFWKCHRDSWRIEKKHFDEDQLVILTDLLVSPSYYA